MMCVTGCKIVTVKYFHNITRHPHAIEISCILNTQLVHFFAKHRRHSLQQFEYIKPEYRMGYVEHMENNSH